MSPSRVALNALKVTISGVLLVVLFRRVDVSRLATTASHLDGRFLTMGLLAFAAGSVFEILKFRAACHFRLGWRLSAKLVFIGLFFNNLLPSNIGGDAYKLWELRRRSVGTQSAVAYLLSDRATGFLALMLLGSAGFITAAHHETVLRRGDWTPSAAASWVGSFLALAVIAGCALGFWMSTRPLIYSRIAKARKQWIAAGKTYLAVTAVPTMLYSLLLHSFRAVALHLVCRSVGFQVSFASIFQVLALVALASMLPITIGGLGVRESAFVFFWIRVGMTREAALATALVSLGVVCLKSLVGLLVFLRERHSTSPSAVDTQIPSH